MATAVPPGPGGAWRVASRPVSESGRIALVTGASSGIGAETVRALAAAGYETVAAARRLERCEALAAEVGGRALALDVTDPESVSRLADELPRVHASSTAPAARSGSSRLPRPTRTGGARCSNRTCSASSG